MIVAMQRLDNHPAIRAGNRTIVFVDRYWATASGPMDCLGSADVVRDVTIELCFLRGLCRAYMGSRGDCSR
jgi:hypothetical protein